MAIERTSQGSNVQWSDVIAIALGSTDWDIVQAAMNASDDDAALAEAEDIIRGDAGPTA